MDIKAKYDPLLFKFPKGVVVKNNEVRFHIDLECEFKPRFVYFMIKTDEESEYKYLEMTEKNGYEFVYKFEKSGHYWYNFQIVVNDEYLYLNRTYDNYSYLSHEKGEDFLQLVTEKEYSCKDSMQGGIIYQIFVDRFCKVGEVKERKPLILRDDWGGNIQKNTTNPLIINLEVFGGNIQGIISKLDYLQKLGVTTIYLNPISQANSSHKYDTSDYMKIDDMFGTELEFKKLVDLAKAYGMKIVIDGVYNHTGSDSIYFNKNGTFNTLGAYKSKESRFYNWYDFENYPDKYKCWWGIDTLPSIKHNSEDFQNYIAGENGVLEKFLKLGVFGVRLDVVDEIGHNYLTKICDSIRENKKDALIIGEVWEDASTKIAYGKRRGYFLGHELNSVMNYPLKEALLNFILHNNANHFYYVCQIIEDNYPEFVKHNLMNLIDSHDTRRILSILEEGNHVMERLKIISALQYGFYGNPSIFYGDEVGIREDEPDFCRKCFPWGNENKEILQWYKFLGELRKHKVFKKGKMEPLKAEDGIIIFKRVCEDEEILFAASVSNDVFTYLLYDSYTSLIDGSQSNKVKIKPYQIHILKKD